MLESSSMKTGRASFPPAPGLWAQAVHGAAGRAGGVPADGGAFDRLPGAPVVDVPDTGGFGTLLSRCDGDGPRRGHGAAGVPADWRMRNLRGSAVAAASAADPVSSSGAATVADQQPRMFAEMAEMARTFGVQARMGGVSDRGYGNRGGGAQWSGGIRAPRHSGCRTAGAAGVDGRAIPGDAGHRIRAHLRG